MLVPLLFSLYKYMHTCANYNINRTVKTNEHIYRFNPSSDETVAQF